MLAAAAAFVIFLSMLFSAEGMLSGIILLAIYFLPMYLILDLFELSNSEKAAFAFFISLGAVPTLTYWLGFLVSFKLAAVSSFFIMMAAWYVLKSFIMKKKC